MDSSKCEEDVSSLAFSIEFPASNSFRQVLEFLNHNHQTVPLCFSRDKLSIRTVNDMNTICVINNIYAENMLDYYVNPALFNDNDEYFIHVPIAPILTNLKRFQKKQKIRILQYMSKPNFITIPGEESGSTSSDIRIDPSRKEPEDEIELEDFGPNVTIQLSAFNYSATGCGKTSDRVSKVCAYKRGVEILSSSAQGVSVIRKGDCSGESISEFSISGDIMKSISKLASLCDEGIVRIYAVDSSYIKLEVPISVIGTSQIFFTNVPMGD